MLSLKYNLKGSTLVECIVSFSLFTIASVILLTGFLTSAKIIVRANEIKKDGIKVESVADANQVDNEVIQSEKQSKVRFKVNGNYYEVEGKYSISKYNDVIQMEFYSGS